MHARLWCDCLTHTLWPQAAGRASMAQLHAHMSGSTAAETVLPLCQKYRVMR